MRKDLENSKKLGRIEGKLYTLKTMIGMKTLLDNHGMVNTENLELKNVY